MGRGENRKLIFIFNLIEDTLMQGRRHGGMEKVSSPDAAKSW